MDGAGRRADAKCANRTYPKGATASHGWRRPASPELPVSRPARSLIVLALLLSPVIASAQSLNVDIGAVGGTPSSGFGAAAGQPGTWNEIGLGSTSNLSGLSGAGTGVSVAVAADTDTGSELTCAGDIGALINDNVYRLGANAVWTVTFSGLANGPYTVYLYGPVNTAVNTGTMNVNGTSVPNISGDACTLASGVTFQTVLDAAFGLRAAAFMAGQAAGAANSARPATAR